MSSTSDNNHLIAKNTLLLYARMFLMFAISLFTSRIVLQTLGVTDYGLYNVVGGVITMFSFMTGAMGTSTQRYLTYYLGLNEAKELKNVFSMAVFIHGLIALAILVLGETIGLWFVMNKLVIPADRMDAAMWVYQLSILTSMIQIISVPYNADIIAHEKMSAFAYISILEAALKLVIVYLLLVISFDKLRVYAVLIFMVELLIRYIYGHYCGKHFEEAHFKIPHNKALFKEMFFFAGWNLWGNLAGVLFGQGLNILLNMFFGPAVNAARGVAVQVQGAITQFSTNFQTALNPQITKTYAANNLEDMHRLLYRASKFSFMLLFILSIPVFMETPAILKAWLGLVPDYTSIFIKIMLGCAIVDATARPLMTAAAATGNVKIYQSVIGGILLAILPISYLALKLGAVPWAVFVVHFIIEIFAFIVRLIIVGPMIKLSIHKFFTNAIAPSLGILVVSVPIPLLVHVYMPDNYVRAIVVIIISVLCASFASYALGLTKHEREFVKIKVRTLCSKFYK